MLTWALRHVAIAAVVAAGFASLQGSDWLRGLAPSRLRPVAGQPARGVAGGDLEHVIEAGPGGHFVVEAIVNGTPLPFLIDTGASDIVLTMRDARRLGLEPAALRFDRRFRTANGEVRVAAVRLRELRLGQLRLFDVDAWVNQGRLGISLLGMSFLRRLRSYEVVGQRLILRW